MNESLKQSWLSLTSKFEALNKRERWLVFGASVFVVYSLMNMLFLSPVLAKKKILAGEISADQSQIDTLKQQIAIMNSQGTVDPDAQNNQRIADLQSNLNQLETELGGMQSTLINPEKMPELLRSMLKKNGKLKLVELKTMPATGLLKSTQNNASASSAQLTEKAAEETNKSPEDFAFKHGVEITVEGRYLDLLDYVHELENTPWHI